MRVWDKFLTEQDRAVFAQSGHGKRGGFGSRPALLVVDMSYAFCGDKDEPITESVKRLGLKASPLARYMLSHPKMKHWVRMYYTLQSAWKLKEASTKGFSHSDFWQAGKSVEGIDAVASVAEVMAEFRSHLA